MTAGIIYPSVGRLAAWNQFGGAAPTAGYPITNLAGIDEPRKPLIMPAGANIIRCTLPALTEIDSIAFIHHNAAPADTFRVRVSPNADATVGTTYISGLEPFYPTGWGAPDASYPNVRIFRFPTPQTSLSVYINLTANTVPWQIGGIEIGLFWPWNDVTVPREIGVSTNAVVDSMGRSAQHVMSQWAPRTVKGSRTLVPQSELDGKVQDFHADTGIDKAFVWSWDVDDATTYARQTFLATNDGLPPPNISGYEVGEMEFSFREHLR